jgi:diguanylate cyclase (GGDEF)-like protein
MKLSFKIYCVIIFAVTKAIYMVSRLQEWIVQSIAAGAFSRRADVLRFASKRSLVTTLAAIGLNFLIYEVFGRIGLATIPIDPVGDAVVTACVAGPISFLAYYLVGRAIRELAISRDAFERMSRIDPLTGLLNRRAFTDAIAAIRAPYVIAVIDIDRFKLINDTHGHSAGDKVLIEVAAELRSAFGDEVVLARLGGEEFGVVMPDRGREEALAVLERARAVLENHIFHVSGGQITVTFSAGLSRSGGEEGFSMLLSDADKALYLAKAAGRNRVVHVDDLAVISPVVERMPQQLAG